MKGLYVVAVRVSGVHPNCKDQIKRVKRIKRVRDNIPIIYKYIQTYTQTIC